MIDKGENLSSPNEKSYYSGTVWGMVITSTLGMFQFGYILAILNTLMQYFQRDVYNFNDKDKELYSSILNSVVPVGAMIGAVSAGPIVKKIGRRTSMIIIDIVISIGSLFTLITNINLFIIGRAITGFCIGFNSTLVPLYMNEITPLSIKGLAGAFNQVQICIGSFIAVLLAFGLPDADFSGLQGQWWRVMLGFPILIGSIRLVFFLLVFTKETPYYLVYNNEREKAEEALGRIYKQEYVGEQLHLLEHTRKKEEEENKVTLKDLFGPRYRKRLVIGCFLNFLIQMTGMNAFIIYSTDIFSNGRTADAAVTLSTMFTLTSVLATFASGQLIHRFGRKTILIWGDITITITLIVTSILFLYDSYQALVYPIFLFIVLLNLSVGPMIWIYTAEILPDIGVGIAVVFNWLGAFLVALLFPLISSKDALGPGPSFGIFAAYCIFALFVLMSCVKETSGLTPAQINELFTEGKISPTNAMDTSSSQDSGISLQHWNQTL